MTRNNSECCLSPPPSSPKRKAESSRKYVSNNFVGIPPSNSLSLPSSPDPKYSNRQHNNNNNNHLIPRSPVSSSPTVIKDNNICTSVSEMKFGSKHSLKRKLDFSQCNESQSKNSELKPLLKAPAPLKERESLAPASKKPRQKKSKRVVWWELSTFSSSGFDPSRLTERQQMAFMLRKSELDAQNPNNSDRILEISPFVLDKLELNNSERQNQRNSKKHFPNKEPKDNIIFSASSSNSAGPLNSVEQGIAEAEEVNETSHDSEPEGCYKCDEAREITSNVEPPINKMSKDLKEEGSELTPGDSMTLVDSNSILEPIEHSEIVPGCKSDITSMISGNEKDSFFVPKCTESEQKKITIEIGEIIINKLFKTSEFFCNLSFREEKNHAFRSFCSNLHPLLNAQVEERKRLLISFETALLSVLFHAEIFHCEKPSTEITEDIIVSSLIVGHPCQNYDDYIYSFLFRVCKRLCDLFNKFRSEWRTLKSRQRLDQYILRGQLNAALEESNMVEMLTSSSSAALLEMETLSINSIPFFID